MGEQENNDGCSSGVQIQGFDSFNSYIAEGYKVVSEGVKASGSLPSSRNYQFYQTYSEFRDKMREKCSQLIDIMEDVLSSQDVKSGVRDVMIEDAMDTMLTINDKMLDRATRTMDVMEGIKTGMGELVEEVSGSWNKSKTATKSKNQFSLNVKKNVPRPQFTFKDKIDNSNTAWEPKIKDKPNALKPLAILLERNDDGDECFSHPYEYELELFSVPDTQLRVTKPCKPLVLENTPLELIETEDGLRKILPYLESQTAIAVDLENHSYRSFMGFTCLMQISTREKDIIIDCLKLREFLHCLNSVFTNPKILKVFHGGDHDIMWLQRDFNVYVVNMFDTHQAAKMLNYPKLSLAYLLNKFCHVDANKHFQLFDWRIRPLPEEAVRYAREDTHYLLYIADMMSNELIDKANGDTNLLKAVYHQSKLVCLKRFERLVIDEESFMSVYRKGKRFFDNRQLFALKALYLWRDKTGRELDESLAYVFPDSMMLNVAENLPREVQGILACCNPVPPLVKANLLEIHYLIVKAKEQPLVKVIGDEAVNRSMQTSQKASGFTEEQRLLEEWRYPSAEVRQDVPTLLGNTDADDGQSSMIGTDEEIDCIPSLAVFNKEVMFDMNEMVESLAEKEVLESVGRHFVSPYQRYVRVLPYAALIEQERKEAELKEAEEARLKSRQQQALAMEIKSLQDSGVIKLKNEDPEKPDEAPLKVQVMNERSKRRKAAMKPSLNESSSDHRHKKPRLSGGSDDECAETEVSQQNQQVELRGSSWEGNKRKAGDDRLSPQVKQEKVKTERVDSGDETADGASSRKRFAANRPTSWRELRQQKGQGAVVEDDGSRTREVEPFDYSQVDFSRKFSRGGRGRGRGRGRGGGGQRGGRGGRGGNNQAKNFDKKWKNTGIGSNPKNMTRKDRKRRQNMM